MKLFTKTLLALLGIVALTMTSCQTMRGIGHDISAGGAAISSAASR